MSGLNYIPVADVYNSFIVNLKTQVSNEFFFELIQVMYALKYQNLFIFFILKLIVGNLICSINL